MRTDTVIISRTVAGKAKSLKSAILREPFLAQPSVQTSTTTTNLTAMLCTIVLYMVDSQNFLSVFIAACTLTTVGCKRFLAKSGIPDHHVGLFFRLVAHIFE